MSSSSDFHLITLSILKVADHFISHNIQNPLPDLSDVQQIYNLACPASPVHYQKDPVSTLSTCFVGTQHLLEFAKAGNLRILHTSTSGESSETA